MDGPSSPTRLLPRAFLVGRPSPTISSSKRNKLLSLPQVKHGRFRFKTFLQFVNLVFSLSIHLSKFLNIQKDRAFSLLFMQVPREGLKFQCRVCGRIVSARLPHLHKNKQLGYCENRDSMNYSNFASDGPMVD